MGPEDTLLFHKNTALVTILSQMILINTLTKYLFKINFNIIPHRSSMSQIRFERRALVNMVIRPLVFTKVGVFLKQVSDYHTSRKDSVQCS
jgi:hypothetical protein